MKKKTLSMLLVTAMATSMLIGCGGTDEEQNNALNTQKTDGSEVVTSDDVIANLIAATDGTVELTLWCAETEEYQTVMKEIVDEFKAT